jgi:acetylornithine deacetylase/succinyl-diaminopimelate desuccinylase-like protein
MLIGPGSILDAHTSHERVAKTELMEAVNRYVGLAETLANRDVETSVSETLSEVPR